MRLFVTGGAGFIGSNFVRLALEEELFPDLDSILVVDSLTYAGDLENLQPYLRNQDLIFVEGNICDKELMKSLLCEGDVLVNFAAESHVDRSIYDASPFVHTNVMGTQVLLDAALLARASKFIQISTDEVYGSVVSGKSIESDLLLPNSPYSASKASADMIARSYTKTFGMDVRITRCSNNYGPQQFPEKLIPLFISNLLKGMKVPVYGTGNQVREWIHVNDHCRGIAAVINHGSPGEIYNIGTGDEFSNLDLTRTLIQALGASEMAIEYVADRAGHDFRYALDCQKIQTTLGWSPKVQFADGISDTINWYKNKFASN